MNKENTKPAKQKTSKRLNQAEVYDQIHTAIEQIDEAVKVLKKRCRSLGVFKHPSNSAILDEMVSALEYASADLDDVFDSFSGKVDAIRDAYPRDESSADEPKALSQLSDLGPSLFSSFFDSIVLSVEAMKEGMPAAIEKRRQKRLEEEGKFDWPDAIDVEKENAQKQLPPGNN